MAFLWKPSQIATALTLLSETKGSAICTMHFTEPRH